MRINQENAIVHKALGTHVRALLTRTRARLGRLHQLRVYAMLPIYSVMCVCSDILLN